MLSSPPSLEVIIKKVKIVNGCEVSSEIVMCKLRMLCTRENLLNILLTMEIEIKRLYCSSIT